MFKLNLLQKRRLSAFRANRRAFWSFWVFMALFLLSLMAEFVANDKPLLLSYRGEWRSPVLQFYSEVDFGGEFRTEAEYDAPEVQCLILTGGDTACFSDETAALNRAEAEGRKGWMLWPLIPYSYNTINYDVVQAPSAPDADHWLGTDDQSRDVVARVIYGFRISVLFAFVMTGVSSILGILAGALQGYFGGWLDLILQRIVEIWSSTPTLYVLIIVAALFNMTFWTLLLLLAIFGWTGLVGVVRAEFLRARNFEYVRAAQALGMSDWRIMYRHVLPNAMVATVTLMPFLITGAIAGLSSLDYLGLGLPASYPSLGELTRQGTKNLFAPWLGISAFVTFAVMLSLLVFIFEGVRDAFDPRKTLE